MIDDSGVTHPSLRAARAHRAANEPLCAACDARAPHGTKSGYDSWGCRCPSCSSAARAYRRRDPALATHPSTLAAKGHRAAGEPLCAACLARAPHGTLAAYSHWYCRCSSCVHASRVDYRRRREEILAYQATYRDDHRPFMRERDRRYRRTNAAVVAQRQAEGRVRRRNRSYHEIAAAQIRLRPDGLKECRDCHRRESLSEFHRDRTSPDGLMADCRTCDSKKRYGLTTAQYDAIIASTGGLCIYCGDPYEHLDHVIPKDLHGPDHPDNLAPACEPCNKSKLASPLSEWWPRHLAERLDGVPPKQTWPLLSCLLARHGVVVNPPAVG